MLYLIQLFLPLAFLPILRANNLVLFLFPAGLTLLASSPALYSFSYQYTLYFVAPAMIATVYFLWGNRRQSWGFFNGITVALLFSALIMSYQYGVIFNQRYVVWQRDSIGPLTISRDEYRHYLELRTIVKQIPADGTGVLCEGELCAHLEHVYDFHQIGDKYPESAFTANYVLMGSRPGFPGGQRAEDPMWEKAGLTVTARTEHFVLYKRVDP